MRQIREVRIKKSTPAIELEGKEAINRSLTHPIPLDSPLWICTKEGGITIIRIDVDSKDEN